MSNAPAVHEAASLPRRPPAARKPRGLWLWLAAIGVALTLCGSETVSGGRKNVFNPDHYTQLTHVVSVADAIAEGQIPPRVSPFLSRGLGNPYHQFYPPFSHAAPAALGALAGDAMAGYAAAAVLFTALCFVYSWKLSRLLTLSDASAAAGAFLFTAAPYLLFDRISRSAWPEYAAFSMLPLVLYLLLRWAAAGGLWRLLAASAALACLFATHLVTSFLFACFLAAFAALWSLNSLRLRGAEGRVIRGKIAGRVLRALAAGAFGALIAACYLGPAALYGDLYMKRVHLPASPFGDSRFFVPLLALLSASDSRLVETDMVASLRIQMGTALLLSCLAYAWSLLRP
ncbi:MAG: hypothetical protein LBG06_10050, partial [Deltaproteobacteria bacterium]|nr:hypothetical protein [Deltaproteobacteria bacterium]